MMTTIATVFGVSWLDVSSCVDRAEPLQSVHPSWIEGSYVSPCGWQR
jgi:hypothetical protein